MRIVVDTNVLISSALLPDSTPAIALEFILKKHIHVTSKEILQELQLKLTHKKFRKYISEDEVSIFLHKLYKISELTELIQRVKICRDPKDNMVIDTAINGNASVIVSGDKDLTDIEKYKNIKILSAKQFLDSQIN